MSSEQCEDIWNFSSRSFCFCHTSELWM